MTTPERRAISEVYATLDVVREATERAILSTALSLDEARSRMRQAEFLVADVTRELETQRTFLEKWKGQS